MAKRKSPSNDSDNKKKYKRSPSAYSLFVKSSWEKDEKKENFTIFTKGCSALWAKMTDVEKQQYKDEAATMKERQGVEKSDNKKSDSKKKRAPGPYIIFCSEMREKIKKENPGLTMTQISKELGILWKKLTDAEKSKYQQMSNDEKLKLNKGIANLEEEEKPEVNDKEESNNEIEGIPSVEEPKSKKKKGKIPKTAIVTA